MAEEQGVIGDYWHTGINRFLQEVMSWNKVGDSNVDIYCPSIKGSVGIDSVFSYKRHQDCCPQIVFLEAKTVKSISSVNSTSIEKWVKRFLEVVEHAPNSKDFHEKFQPDSNAQYNIGLIALLVRDNKSFDENKINTILSSIHVPVRRKTPINIHFVSNDILLQFCAIYETLKKLEASEEYISIRNFFPSYGDLPIADGECIPLETLLSKFFFCKSKKKMRKGAKDIGEYESSIIFYLGKIESYEDFRFIGLAAKHFNLFQSQEVEIYTLFNKLDMRHNIENFQQEFSQATGSDFTFKQLNLFQEIPGWLSEQ